MDKAHQSMKKDFQPQHEQAIRTVMAKHSLTYSQAVERLIANLILKVPFDS